MTEQQPARTALFAGLVRDEDDRPVDVVLVDGVPFYVVNIDGFLRHVEAETIDRQVIGMLRDQFMENREIATEAMMQMLGKDDLFTKAMIDASVKHMDDVVQRGLPDEVRAWLGMLGFRVVVDSHGEVCRLDMPEQTDGFEE